MATVTFRHRWRDQLRRSKETSTVKVIGFAMSVFCNGEGHVYKWRRAPSALEIASEAGRSRITALRGRAILALHGWIAYAIGGRGQGDPGTYFLTIPRPRVAGPPSDAVPMPVAVREEIERALGRSN